MASRSGRLAAVLLGLLRPADGLRSVVPSLVALRRPSLLAVASLWSVAEPEAPAVWNTALCAAVGIRTAVGHAIAAPTGAAILSATVAGPAATVLATIALTAIVAIVSAVATLTATTISVVAPRAPVALAAVARSATVMAPASAVLAAAVVSPGAAFPAAVAATAAITPAAASVVPPPVVPP